MHHLIPFDLRVKSNELIAFSVVYSVLILVLVTNYSLINNENGKNFAYGFKSQAFLPLQPPLSLQQITLHQLKSSNRHLNSSNRHLSLQQITLHQLNSSNRHLSLQQITLHRLKSSNRHLNSSNRHLSLQQITLHRLNNCSVKGQLNHLCRYR